MSASKPPLDDSRESQGAQPAGKLNSDDETRRLDRKDRVAAVTPSSSPLGRIGKYHIKRAIATGGMGTVYQAIQEKPRREVALKVMRQGVVSPQTLRRFEHESQWLAQLRHPCIAQVYEAGTHQDATGAVPFFAMEFIPNARSITRFAREQGLDTRAKLELFIKVCDAVQHGHQKGIIHRDLKPGNILVDGQGQVKIIDFGVARSTDTDLTATTMHTEAGEMIGTLKYMSPEQCTGDPTKIKTRSDVYALGIVLYEVLTDRYPFDLGDVPMIEATRVIRDATPTSLSSIDRSLRGDVETIVFKAMEKDTNRRYDSALALSEDIRRFLSDQPILARPPSGTYRLGKWITRRRLPLAAGMLLAMAIIAVVYAKWDAYRARLAAQRIQQSAYEQFGMFYRPNVAGHVDQRQKSIADLTGVIELQPDLAQPYALRAKLRVYQKKYDEAMRDCQRSLELDKENSLALRVMGRVLLEQGDLDGAIAAYDLGMADSDGNYLPEDYFSRARLRRLSGDYGAALADHDQAVTLAPRVARVLFQRGITRRFAGDLDGAIEDFTSAAEYDPDWYNQCTQWIWEIRMLRGMEGDREAAVASLTIAISKANSDIDRQMLQISNGTISANEVLARMKTSKLRCCAHYYLGARALVDGQPSDAAMHFELCLTSGERLLPEFEFAEWHLRRLHRP